MILIAKLRLWLHIQMASAPKSNHDEFIRYRDFEMIKVACSCGRIFWEKKL